MKEKICNIFKVENLLIFGVLYWLCQNGLVRVIVFGVLLLMVYIVYLPKIYKRTAFDSLKNFSIIVVTTILFTLSLPIKIDIIVILISFLFSLLVIAVYSIAEGLWEEWKEKMQFPTA